MVNLNLNSNVITHPLFIPEVLTNLFWQLRGLDQAHFSYVCKGWYSHTSSLRDKIKGLKLEEALVLAGYSVSPMNYRDLFQLFKKNSNAISFFSESTNERLKVPFQNLQSRLDANLEEDKTICARMYTRDSFFLITEETTKLSIYFFQTLLKNEEYAVAFELAKPINDYVAQFYKHKELHPFIKFWIPKDQWQVYWEALSHISSLSSNKQVDESTLKNYFGKKRLKNTPTS